LSLDDKRALSFFRVLFAGLPSEWDIRFIVLYQNALQLKCARALVEDGLTTNLNFPNANDF
jgi:hypothetical protein